MTHNRTFLITALSALIVGFFFPKMVIIFAPYTEPALMIALFFSLIKVDFKELGHIVHHPLTVIYLTLIKLVVLPLTMFYLVLAIYPAFAVGALLLSGISVGSFAPFMSNLLGAKTPIVIVLVVLSSLLLPLTLPGLVKLLAGTSIDVSFYSMMVSLAKIIVIPLVLAYLVHKFMPNLGKTLHYFSFSATTGLFFLIISASFGKYMINFNQDLFHIIILIIAATILAFVYLFFGYYALCHERKAEIRITSAVSMVWVNALLVVVFANKYFTPVEAGLALMYLIPYELMLIPAEMMMKRLKGK